MSADSTTAPETGDVRHTSGTIAVPREDLQRGGPAHAVGTGSKRSRAASDPRHPARFENPDPVETRNPSSHMLVAESFFDGLDGRLTRFLGADKARVLRIANIDFSDRADIGQERYGVELSSGNGRDTLIDLVQESIDAVAYARTLLGETDSGSEAYSEIEGLYKEHLMVYLKTRAVLARRNGEIEARRVEPKKPAAPAGDAPAGAPSAVDDSRGDADSAD